ncbi:hypothetical protein CLV28_1831 [Sediminihabitans luteus]|uniref:DUF998 domain-containing protein n=1 Tax=Sediminihabitans luteus TaxID=1138585 RepID=A0A2M9CR71_9CELL|nr:hypothetical protein [Sediminihabitans luteus]PJJ74335.1 hypothetical protein CLV28_1831 [Sediminihabitans luteus]GIJ00447.1 hypothetical protein Slu03_28240 [Sediminihabitans luteus]
MITTERRGLRARTGVAVRAMAQRHPHDDWLAASVEGRVYLRTYLYLRLTIGVVGLLLPVVLVLGELLWREPGDPLVRGSLSAYYHSGMRDWFVGSLLVVAAFLVAYLWSFRDWDSRISTAAGILAVIVAFCPTSGGPLTPVQQALGEQALARVHIVAAAVFIVLLGVLSALYGWRAGRRPATVPGRSPAFWRALHWSAAGVIAAAVLGVAVVRLLQATGVLGAFERDRVLLVAEWAAVWAFSVSWLAKGWDSDRLLRRRTA